MSDAPLHLVPVRSRQTKEFMRTWYRHHPPPAARIFAVATTTSPASTDDSLYRPRGGLDER
ncbi:hypothetical protein [Streptomyces sp. NRRL S-1521]|uniref:hypothetical protein n=1 Tax=Streptomyces sp. NRRL S-1521 TaxID=1609100 RepID=UPI000746AE5F|nr:hypothetical protein [Streptomyces sp. NRRL S-1521]KUL53167.1 hypothetical protein ADL30_20695 [Streptomyces sp. NRRL S-1521]